MPILTQSVTVPSPGGAGTHPASYSFIHGYSSGFRNGNTGVSVQATTPGNLLVVNASISGNQTGIGVGAPGTTGWQDTGNGPVFDATIGDTLIQWMGIVQASQTTVITVSWANPSGTEDVDVSSQEFSCAGVTPSTTWMVDRFGKSNGTSANPTYPPLTLSGAASPVLYVGTLDTTGVIAAGSTSGFSYTGVPNDGILNAYNPATVAAATPNGVITSSHPYKCVAAEFYASILTATVNGVLLTMQPVPTGRMWVVSQITFEFLPANVLSTITATISMNGRVVAPAVNPNSGIGFQGPPFISVNAGDVMTVQYVGAPIGASAITNFFYNEYPAGTQPNSPGGLI